MSDTPATTLTITAQGPAIEGRLPLAEVARLCGEFQSTMERIALGLQGSMAVPGRRPRDVVDAVRLVFTGFHTGSAVLELEQEETAGSYSLLGQALEVLRAGSTAVLRGDFLPEAMSTQVLDGLIRLSGGLGDGGVTRVVISRGSEPIVTIDNDYRQALRAARHRVQRDEATIVGLLQMGDFAPSALRCRIDTLDSSVLCGFDESFGDQILACLGRLVLASGTGEFLPGGLLRSLDLAGLTVLTETKSATLDDLAAEQAVRPWDGSEGFGFGDEIGDDDFLEFLSAALSSRSEG